MSKRVSSSNWTGPIDRTVRQGAFTHRVGEFGGTTDYAWLSRTDPISFAVPEKLRGVVRLAAWSLLSPLVLIGGWFAGGLGVSDEVVSDASGILLLWGMLVVAFAFWQLTSRSLHLILVRTFLLGLLMATTLGASIGYAIVAQRIYTAAAVGEPQRVFRYVAGSRRNMFGRRVANFRHQRENGTDIEGQSKWPPKAHGHCITVQPIRGRYGFRWLRVVEQVPPPRAGQLAWPVRRADCFSDTPLTELVR